MKRYILILSVITLLATVVGTEATGKTLKLKSESGIKLKADFYESDNPKSPAVLILPGLSGKREKYRSFSKKLQKSGMNVLAVSYYKMSTVQSGASHKHKKEVFQKRGETMGLLDNEVTTALNFLRSHQKVNPERIGVLGGSLGTWIGFNAMAKFPDLIGLVMLSPICGVSGKSFRTYEGTVNLAKAFGDRHLLLVGSEKDRYSKQYPSAVEKSEYLISIMPNAKIKKKYYPGKSHSYFMLQDHKDLQSIIIQWFQEVL